MASLANAVDLLGLPSGLPAPLGLFFNCLLLILPQVIDLVRVILYYFLGYVLLKLIKVFH
jgi:hypothetical protein